MRDMYVFFIFLGVLIAACLAGIFCLMYGYPELAGICFAVFGIVATALALVFEKEPVVVVNGKVEQDSES